MGKFTTRPYSDRMLKRPIRWTQRPSLRKGARQLSVPSAGWGPPSVRRRVAAGRPGSGRGVCAEGGAVPFAAPTPSAACWAETRHHRLFSLASRARSVPPVGALGGQPGGRRDRDAVHLPVLQRLRPPASPAFSTPRSHLGEPPGGSSTHWAALPPLGSEGRPQPRGPRKGALPTFSASSWVPFWLFRLLSTCLHSLH